MDKNIHAPLRKDSDPTTEDMRAYILRIVSDTRSDAVIKYLYWRLRSLLQLT